MSQPVWGIEVSPEARRGLHRLPEKVAAAIVEFITGRLAEKFITGRLAENPHRVSKNLTGPLAGYRSARRGDYRVVIKIIDGDHVVLVDRIDHRANIYRPRAGSR